MNEIPQSYARTFRILDATVDGVAIVSIIATVLATTVSILAPQAVWLELAVPMAAIVAAAIGARLVQRRAVRRHKALCDAALSR